MCNNVAATSMILIFQLWLTWSCITTRTLFILVENSQLRLSILFLPITFMNFCDCAINGSDDLCCRVSVLSWDHSPVLSRFSNPIMTVITSEYMQHHLRKSWWWREDIPSKRISSDDIHQVWFYLSLSLDSHDIVSSIPSHFFWHFYALHISRVERNFDFLLSPCNTKISWLVLNGVHSFIIHKWANIW